MDPDSSGSTVRHGTLVVGFGLLVLLAFAAGCAGLADESGDSRLDLAVQNQGTTAIEYQLTVTDGDGVPIANETATLEPGVARSYDFTVATPGRHEASVVGTDWAGRVAWDADACAHYEASVRVDGDEVAVASECVQFA